MFGFAETFPPSNISANFCRGSFSMPENSNLPSEQPASPAVEESVSRTPTSPPGKGTTVSPPAAKPNRAASSKPVVNKERSAPPEKIASTDPRKKTAAATSEDEPKKETAATHIEELLHHQTWLERLRHDLPGMATSIVVHALLFFSLTFMAIPAREREKIFTTLLASTGDGSTPGDTPGSDTIDTSSQKLDLPAGVTATTTSTTEPVGTPVPIPTAPAALDAPPPPSPTPLDISDFKPGGGGDGGGPGSGTGTGTGTGPGNGSGGINKALGIFGGRGSSAARGQLVASGGGTAGSENAVDAGLKWLARQQRSDGSWSFHHGPDNPGSLKSCENGATAFALLAFLGRGHVHNKKGKDNPYQETVRRGLDYMLYHMRATPDGGDLRAPSGEGSMYVQGAAALALCEAYAISKDKRKLLIPAQESLRFIVTAQDPRGGGWAYGPRGAGDTSVVGWQLMALKAGQNASIRVPSVTWGKAALFLNDVSSDDGAKYQYRPGPPGGTPTLTSVGLLCRMYMGWTPKVPALERGVVYLSKTGPSADMYYNYYATQVLHHWGGEPWVKWNSVMRDRLVNLQVKEGPSAGSWAPMGGHIGGSGGRLLETCFCIMTLEVYYRHLPLYKRELFSDQKEKE